VSGWNSEHPYLDEAIDTQRPGLVVEVGAWKGASVISMARRIRDAGLDGCVLAVDTWRGSAEHFLHDEIPDVDLYDLFRSNVSRSRLDDYVVPLPLDSLNAATVVGARGLNPCVVHLDAGHDYLSVAQDLEAWWPLLAPGGVMIVDDYGTDAWPYVKRAVDDYFWSRDDVEALGPKCRVFK